MISGNLEDILERVLETYIKGLEFHQYCDVEEKLTLEIQYLNTLTVLDKEGSMKTKRYAIWYNEYKERETKEYQNQPWDMRK